MKTTTINLNINKNGTVRSSTRGMKISSSEATWKNKPKTDDKRKAIYKKGFLYTLENFKEWQGKAAEDFTKKERWEKTHKYFKNSIIPHIKEPTKLIDAAYNKAGIYMFTNKITKKTYIGKSNNLYKRITDYYWLANANQKFTFSKMHRIFEQYGISNFKITIIENCEQAILSEREQFYINTLKPQYNIRTMVKAKTERIKNNVKTQNKKEIRYP